MSKYTGLGRKLNDQLKNDPIYVAEGLALDVALQLGKILEKRGFQRKELAKKVGVSPAYISELLNGATNMTLLTLSKFAIALGLEATILLKNSEEKYGVIDSYFCPDDWSGVFSTDASQPRCIEKPRMQQPNSTTSEATAALSA